MTEAKCDFCDKVAVAYGTQQCYFACQDHIEKGRQIESNLHDIWEAVCEDLIDEDFEGTK